MATVQDTLQAAYQNYARLMLLCTQVIAQPTQANVDATLTAAAQNNIVRPKPTSSVDGESYDWTGYQTFLITQMKNLKELIAIESGPYQIESYGF